MKPLSNPYAQRSINRPKANYGLKYVVSGRGLCSAVVLHRAKIQGGLDIVTNTERVSQSAGNTTAKKKELKNKPCFSPCDQQV